MTDTTSSLAPPPSPAAPLAPLRRVLITGASSGLGRGLALELAHPGAQLGLVARRVDELNELAALLQQRGAQAQALPADVTDTRALQQVADDFLCWAGGVDAVIANAGIGEGPSLADAARVAQVFAVNVIGVSNTLLPFVPAMRAQRSGRLVAVGSIAGFRALPGSAAYSASKAAVKTFIDGLRMELAGSGVTAMTLCPGFIKTPLTDRNRFPMPFLMQAEPACALMARAIATGGSTVTFPWQMAALSHVVRRAPERALTLALKRWGER